MNLTREMYSNLIRYFTINMKLNFHLNLSFYIVLKGFEQAIIKLTLAGTILSVAFYFLFKKVKAEPLTNI